MTPELGRPGKAQWASLLVSGAFLAIIFGWLLPMFIDFRDVWEAITQLRVGQVAILASLGLLWMAVESYVSTSLVPGLRFWPGFRGWAASNTASVGPSPIDLAVRYGMYAEVGVTAGAAGAGIFLSGIFGFGIRLMIPTFALGAIAIAGRTGPTGTMVALVAAVGFVLTVGFMAAVVWSSRFTRWTGGFLERLHNRTVVRWNGRPPASGWSHTAEVWRARMAETLADRWPFTLAAATAGQVLTFTIFILSYRFIGLGSDVVGAFDVFVAYAAGLIANFIPGVPGGIGASELIHVLVLTEVSGMEIADEVAAAGFTHRAFTWVMPVVIGAWFLVGWLRRRSAAAAGRLRREP